MVRLAESLRCRRRLCPHAESVNRAASMLRSGLPTALLLNGNALYGAGLMAAGRIAAATGAKLLAPYPITRVERGAGAPAVQRIPYVPEQAIELLKGFRQLILVGAAAPVSYFASPGKNSVLTSPECEIHTLASPGEDYVRRARSAGDGSCRRKIESDLGREGRAAAAAERRDHVGRAGDCGGSAAA